MPESLAAMRDLRAELARLARAFPELVSPVPGDPEAWLATLEAAVGQDPGPGDNVPKPSATSFRPPAGVLDRVDAYAERIAARHGITVSRSDALVSLVVLALDLLDQVEADPELVADAAALRDLVTLGLVAVRARRAEGGV